MKKSIPSPLQAVFLLLAGASLIAACSAVPGGLLSDPANETQSAIASLAAQTPTPLPTRTAIPTAPPAATPQPTAPPAATAASRSCAASDLLANTRADINGNEMVFSISMSNAGNHSCTLDNPPKASLASLQGSSLDIQVKTACADCLPASAAPVGPAASPTPAPTPAATAQGFAAGQVRLGPNQSAGIVLIWKNWCGPFPSGGVTIDLDLGSSQVLVMPTDAQRGGSCIQSGAPSTLDISPYYQIQ